MISLLYSCYMFISFYLQAAQMSQLFIAPPHVLTCTAYTTKRTKVILIPFNVTEPQWSLERSDHLRQLALHICHGSTAKSSN